MNKHTPPILSRHRLHRLILWTLAVLRWFSAVMFSDRAIPMRHMKQRADYICVHWLAHVVANLLIVRALHIVGRTHARNDLWRHNRFKRPSAFRRALLGAKLRRALKHRDLATHIAQLNDLLRNIDQHAARLAHNMRHRRRRLTRIVPAIAAAAVILGPPLVRRSLGVGGAFSDSS